MSRINVLFVCGRNLRRSPTAENLFSADARLSVRSVGTSDTSRRRITQKDLAWASLVLVMESKYEARIRAKFPDIENWPPFSDLDIPDDFEFMEPELIELLLPSVEDAITAYLEAMGNATG